MMILRFACAAESAARQRMTPVKISCRIFRVATRFPQIRFSTTQQPDEAIRLNTNGEQIRLYLPVNLPISSSKKRAESTSIATLVLGTHLSRTTGEVRVPTRVGAEPRT